MLIEYQEAHSGYGQRLGLLALGVWLSGAAFLVGVLAVEGASAGNAAPITIQSTMDSAIDPSADALWASVGTVETQRGTAQRAPQSTAEWGRLLGHAQTLIAGARQLQRPGLAVGAMGIVRSQTRRSRVHARRSRFVPTSIATRRGLSVPPNGWRRAVGRPWPRSPHATPSA